MNRGDSLLIIFAKYPEVGQVKTRLARDIGPERACAFYRLLLQAVLLRTRPEPGDGYTRGLYYTPAAWGEAMRAFLHRECRYDEPLAPQSGGDLGTRMQDACARGFWGGGGRAGTLRTDDPPTHPHRPFLWRSPAASS